MVASHQFKDWSPTFDRIFSVPLPDGWFDAFIDEEPDGGIGVTEHANSIGLLRRQMPNTPLIVQFVNKQYNNGCQQFSGKIENSQFIRVFEYRHSTTCNIGTEFPEEELNALFGVKRLYSLLTQVHNAQKTQKWRRSIDEMFE